MSIPEACSISTAAQRFVGAPRADVPGIFRETPHAGGDVVDHEIHVLIAGAGNVMHGEGEGAGSGRWVGPGERRRGAFAVAGEVEAVLGAEGRTTDEMIGAAEEARFAAAAQGVGVAGIAPVERGPLPP